MVPEGKPERTIHGFKDNKKVGGFPNEIFTLVITPTMSNFDVLRILIDVGVSCDIMYTKLLKKLGSKIERLSHYADSNLQAFKDMLTRSRGI